MKPIKWRLILMVSRIRISIGIHISMSPRWWNSSLLLLLPFPRRTNNYSWTRHHWENPGDHRDNCYVIFFFLTLGLWGEIYQSSLSSNFMPLELFSVCFLFHNGDFTPWRLLQSKIALFWVCMGLDFLSKVYITDPHNRWWSVRMEWKAVARSHFWRSI